MKYFYLAVACVVLALALITLSFHRESTEFCGIADTKEIVVNWETGVEIRHCRVVPGQRVNAGDTLVELSSQDLDMRIGQIGNELSELRTRKSAHTDMSQSEVRQLRSVQAEHISELRDEIDLLELQLETNLRLVSQLRSVKSSGADTPDSSNPTVRRIDGLKRELARALDSSQVSVNELNSQLSFTGNPLQDQIRRLQDELTMLVSLKKRLVFTAQTGGIVGSVNFKEGEKASPFAPIITLHSESPSYVNGYIHESVYSRVAMNQTVRIRSLNTATPAVEGVIVGIGSRIVEYPVRLRKMAEMQMWGREVTIRLPPGNPFLLGEKVEIALPDRVRGPFFSGLSCVPSAHGRTVSAVPGGADCGTAPIRTIAYPDNRTAAIEASGAQPHLLRRLAGLRPEGIAFNRPTTRFMIACDNGNNSPSQMCLLKGVIP